MRLDDLPVARLAAALKGPHQGETESFRGLQNHGFRGDPGSRSATSAAPMTPRINRLTVFVKSRFWGGRTEAR